MLRDAVDLEQILSPGLYGGYYRGWRVFASGRVIMATFCGLRPIRFGRSEEGLKALQEHIDEIVFRQDVADRLREDANDEEEAHRFPRR